MFMSEQNQNVLSMDLDGSIISPAIFEQARDRELRHRMQQLEESKAAKEGNYLEKFDSKKEFDYKKRVLESKQKLIAIDNQLNGVYQVQMQAYKSDTFYKSNEQQLQSETIQLEMHNQLVKMTERIQKEDAKMQKIVDRYKLRKNLSYQHELIDQVKVTLEEAQQEQQTAKNTKESLSM